MERFLERGLEALLEGLETEPSSTSQAGQSLQKSIKAVKKTMNEEMKVNEGEEVTDEQNQWLQPFLLGLKTKSPNLVYISLYWIQKFVAFGYLKNMSCIGKGSLNGENSASDQSDGLEDLIEAVCDCQTILEDNVQLQMIKLLVSFVVAASSETFQIHGMILLKMIRACYQIHLNATSIINRQTAKATLTQMVNLIFTRMEVQGRKKDISKIDKGLCSQDVLGSSSQVLYPEVRIMKELQLSALITGWQVPEPQRRLPVGPRSSGLKFRSLYHEDAFFLLRVLCKLSMKDKNQSVGEIASRRAQYLSTKLLSLELILDILEKAGPEFKADVDTNAVRSVFEPVFKKYLCPSLINNCLQSNTELVALSLKIFLALEREFTNALRKETEIILKEIFLRLIESKNSPLDHKILVLEVMMHLCKNPKKLLTVFYENDCNMQKENLFEMIVSVLCNISNKDVKVLISRKYTAAEIEKEEHLQEELKLSAIHMLALQCLESLVESLFTLLTTLQSQQRSSSRAIHHSSPVSFSEESVSETQSESRELVPEESQSLERVSVYQEKQRLRRVLGIAASKLLVKPRLAIEYLVNEGYITAEKSEKPREVARFLYDNYEHLPKTQIGDYLGGEKEHQLETMSKYVELFHFEALEFDIALRQFLSRFRLPGEGQKIDRLMEKFAAVYCEQNPAVFPSADAAFILAYAVIMLNTDAHNPNIKPEKKMTKAGFVNMNRGIGGGKDLDKQFLEAIFDNIVTNAISLKEDDDQREEQQRTGTNDKHAGFMSTLFGNHSQKANGDSQQRQLYKKELSEIVKTVNNKIETPKGVQQAQVAPADLDVQCLENCQFVQQYATVALISIHGSLCAAFSVNMQNSNDEVVIRICLNILRFGIKLCCRLCDSDRVAFSSEDELGSVRELMVDSLAKFTFLDTKKRLKLRNIFTMNALVDLALTEGNFLATSWTQIMMTISNIFRFNSHGLLAGDLQHFDSYTETSSISSRTSRASKSKSRIRQLRSKRANGSYFSSLVGDSSSHMIANMLSSEEAMQIEEENTSIIRHFVDLNKIERIFINSSLLADSSIVHLFKALKIVSYRELKSSPTDVRDTYEFLMISPFDVEERIFSLQKIIEVLDVNVRTRQRLLWATIWEDLYSYFVAAGCHRNKEISMFVIDALRQLSMKFLEKEELPGFHFQSQFLKPFQLIMQESYKAAATEQIRELILSCFENIILTRGDKLKSGWMLILQVVSDTSSDTNLSVLSLCFNILNYVVKLCLNELQGPSLIAKSEVQESKAVFVQFICSAVSQLIGNTAFNEHMDQVIALLDDLFAQLVQNSADGEGSESMPKDEDTQLLVLRTYARLLLHRRKDTRLKAADHFFDSLINNVNYLSHDLFITVFKSVFVDMFLVFLEDASVVTYQAAVFAHERFKLLNRKCTAESRSENDRRQEMALLLAGKESPKSSMFYVLLNRMGELVIAIQNVDQAQGSKGASTENDTCNTGFSQPTVYEIWYTLLSLLLLHIPHRASEINATLPLQKFISYSVLQVWQDHLNELCSLEKGSTSLQKMMSSCCTFLGDAIDCSIPAVLSNLTFREDALVLGKKVLFDSGEGDPEYIQVFEESTVFYLCHLQLSLLQIVKGKLEDISCQASSDAIEHLMMRLLGAIEVVTGFNKNVSLRTRLQEQGFLEINFFQGKSEPMRNGKRRHSVSSLSSEEGPSNFKDIKLPPNLFKQEAMGMEVLMHYFLLVRADLLEDTELLGKLKESVSNLFTGFSQGDKIMYGFYQQVYISGKTMNLRNFKELLQVIAYREAKLKNKVFLPVILSTLNSLNTLHSSETKTDDALAGSPISSRVPEVSWLYSDLMKLSQVDNREVKNLVQHLLKSSFPTAAA